METQTPTTARARWTFAIVSTALFMVVLDNLVVTTALPSIRLDLGATIQELEWTVNAYTLTFAALLLTGAALGDRFGRRRMFTIGLAVFTTASALAALAPGSGALIAARALQGAGAAIVMPLTLTILSEAFPPGRRGLVIGAWSGISGLGVALGPLVGGAIVDGISWQWIFWVNVPIGLVLLPLAITRLSETTGPDGQLDLPGLALGSTGLLGLVLGLVRGQSLGWTSAPVLAALGTGVILLAGFVAWELRAPAPMLPLRFFRNRAFAAANGVSLAMSFGIFGAIFLGVKAFEYNEKWVHGHVPGPYFHWEKAEGGREVQILFCLYFAMTGMHAIHMVVGLGIMLWLLLTAMKGHYTPKYYNPVEISGLYWHFVDIVWIFLFPLLYLI